MRISVQTQIIRRLLALLLTRSEKPSKYEGSLEVDQRTNCVNSSRNLNAVTG